MERLRGLFGKRPTRKHKVEMIPEPEASLRS
jgi:hypothetical protein